MVPPGRRGHVTLWASHPGCLVQLSPLGVEPLELSPVALTGRGQRLQRRDGGLTVLQVLQDHLRTRGGGGADSCGVSRRCEQTPTGPLRGRTHPEPVRLTLLGQDVGLQAVGGHQVAPESGQLGAHQIVGVAKVLGPGDQALKEMCIMKYYEVLRRIKTYYEVLRSFRIMKYYFIDTIC